MPVSIDTFGTRRHLPHIQRPGKTYYVTFTTVERLVLSPEARDIVFETIEREHGDNCATHAFVVMTDHSHWVFTPYDSETISTIMQRVKGVSSHRINKLLGRRGQLWQDESFDRIVRNAENLRKKCEYVIQNPVRAGLVSTPDDYPWIWREWVEGRSTR